MFKWLEKIHDVLTFLNRYEYSKNTREKLKFIKKKSTGNIKLCYKLNRELSTDGVTLSIEANSQSFCE